MAKLEEKLLVLEGTKINIDDLELDLPTADTFNIENYHVSKTEKEKLTGKHVEPIPSPDLKSCDFETIAGTLEESVSDLSEGQKKIEVALDEGGMKLALNAKRAEVLAQKRALESELNFSEETTKSTSGDFSVFSTGAGPPPNGSGMQCRWRVNVVEALENAKKYPNLPLVSPVWPTHPCGYCVRAYLYFNGHPESGGSHVSIFMRPVHGAYDGLLKWPLDATLTFCILDLLGKNARPWIKNCRSDPDSPCFKQRPPPPSESSPDMNAASGLLDFIPIDTLKKYTKDQTIMLEMSMKPKR
ncbi:TNF receptor-associated factor 5 [Geodia barretti]|nr:TNF receptor-associated factor 5 [Geodia barretti]